MIQVLYVFIPVVMCNQPADAIYDLPIDTKPSEQRYCFRWPLYLLMDP